MHTWAYKRNEKKNEKVRKSKTKKYEKLIKQTFIFEIT